ncbi:MAG: HRDC domain-containing protein [Bacteroidota bacterium]
MKSEEGNGPESRSREENLKSVGMACLKTMVLLERGYGIPYLLRILRGGENAYWKNPDPREFETFGEFSEKSPDYLRHSLHHLVGFDLIAPRLPDYNVLEITDKGLAWLENPTDLMVMGQSLRFSAKERLVRNRLSEFRRVRSEEEFIEPYKLFTDYTLDRIMIEKPEDIAQLAEVPGMSLHRAEIYGPSIMSVIKEGIAEWKGIQKARLQTRVRGPVYREARRRIRNGESFAQITREMGRSPRAVLRYIVDLASLDMVPLKHWIEKQIEGSTLHRAVEYFTNSEAPTLKEAFKTLGIDYDTLSLCRIYAEHVMEKASMKVSA